MWLATRSGFAVPLGRGGTARAPQGTGWDHKSSSTECQGRGPGHPLACLDIAYYRRYVLHHMEANAGASSPPGFPPVTNVATEKTEETVFPRKGRS